MSNHALAERHRLAELLAAAGPDAPTLCAGWSTRDLAAHLVVRERRPDAAAGIRVGALAGHTHRVQSGYAERPYEELLRLFRSGPPMLSPFALPGADEAANTVEYFVHAEDVRRAGEEWTPQPVPPGRADALWRRLPLLARMEAGRRSPVRLELARPDGQSLTVGPAGAPVVRITGEPAELVLFVYGRGERAELAVDGPPDAVTALRHVLPLP
ncbi:TIGR03085 family metal-binding protein [Kitasatospora sp. A2-31]|uniref:TIGR03085 family metal-binding protein n=1 Tax=Kitasatospora sp. A2-31 TaxID=2916414 RepID=UPI001EE783BE|nr:TIGR03085 family metal-binding protein [Kitasatospora sp. A2-31]MCG6493114.1 TIGR03085 family metal-binding protein [Kitasatospora sp. A2-31]